MIIAIDGPAASGKGTLARKIAAHYELHYLDTGSLYRAVANEVLKAGRDPNDTSAAFSAAELLDVDRIEHGQIRSAAVGQAASIVAAKPEVRAAILQIQRDYAARKPGAVLDGRDIGTVVCPDADVKLFVTASPEVRAHRRWQELNATGHPVDEAEVLAEIRERDLRDMSRDIAPLRQAEDAYLLDTSNLDIEAAFDTAVGIIESARK
ncbi:MAG: (d)CMP kinase [Parvibaculaceae bacterium]|nr:(d)CMP kinase [Parvibaculaceae bacterium]